MFLMKGKRFGNPDTSFPFHPFPHKKSSYIFNIPLPRPPPEFMIQFRPCYTYSMPKPNISGKTDVPDYDFPSNRPDTDKTTHNVDYE